MGSSTSWPSKTKLSSVNKTTGTYAGITLVSWYNLSSPTTNNDTTYKLIISMGGAFNNSDYINLQETTYSLAVTNNTTKTGTFIFKNNTGNNNTTSSNTVQAYSSAYSFTKGHSAQTITVTAYIQRTSNTYVPKTTVTGTFTVPAKTKYTVTLNANGGTTSTTSLTKWYGENLSLPTPTRTGYTCLGWSTSKTATTGSFTYTTNSAATLYAIWQANEYTVIYNANGGTLEGTTTINNINYTSSYIIGTDNNGTYIIPSKDNYNFTGWGTSTSSVTYTHGESVTKLSVGGTVNLYAIWESQYSPATQLEGNNAIRTGQYHNQLDEGKYGKFTYNINRVLRTEKNYHNNTPTPTPTYSFPQMKYTLSVTNPLNSGIDPESDIINAITQNVTETTSKQCTDEIYFGNDNLSTDIEYTIKVDFRYKTGENTENGITTDVYSDIILSVSDKISKAWFIMDVNKYGKKIGFGTSVDDETDSQNNNKPVAGMYIDIPIYIYNILINPIGVIQMFGGTTPPNGWLICDGSAVSRTTYSQLFNVIGIAHGDGDGSNTFNLPDLRGRVPIGVGTGTAGTSTNHPIGSKGGQETHTLTTAQMPSHTHYPDGNTSRGFATYTHGAGAGRGKVNMSSGSRYAFLGAVDASSADASGINWASSLSNTGGGEAHNIMQPYTTVNFIIFTGVSTQ